MLAQAESSAAGWRQVITSETLQRAGVMRLGEVLSLARAWQATAVDEYTWRSSAGALAPPGDDLWSVLVDGQPIHAALLGALALERLPVDLGALDSIVLVAAPSLIAGEIASGGSLHLFTRRPARGIHARGRYATGAESGDPGPFGFLPDAVPNRDRFGHDAAVGAAFGGRGWNAGMGLGLGVHIATDPAIAARLQATGGFPRIERVAPSLRIAVDAGGGTHRLSAGRTRIHDWLRLEPYGVELPVRSTLAQAGIAGELPARSAHIEYRIGHERNAVRSLPVVDPPLDFALRTTSAELAISPTNAAAGRRAGIGLVHREIHSDYMLADPRALELRAFGQAAWRPADALELGFAASLRHAAGDIGGGVVLDSRWNPGARNAASLRLAASRALPSVGTGLPALLRRGFGWLGDAGVPVRIKDDGTADAQLAADLAWARHLAPRTRLSAALLFRSARAELVRREGLVFDSGRLAWRGGAEVLTGHTAKVGGISIGLETALARTATMTLWYRAHHVWSPSDETLEAWRALPRHTAGAVALYRPVPGLELEGRASARSATRWSVYTGTAALDSVAARTAGGISLDLSARKLFWNRRISAALAVRNLLDRNLVTHPEGGTTSRAFVISAEAALP